MSSENSNFYLNIGMKLKAKREEKGYSYAELAELADISKSSLQRYETGSTRKIPMEAIAKLERALGLSEGYLMGWTQPAGSEKKCDEELIEEFPELIVTKPTRTPVSLLSEYTSAGNFVFAERSRGPLSHENYMERSSFCFSAPDNSMQKARIKKGDLVFIDRQGQATKGEIELISVKGKLMLRHAYRSDGHWTFSSADVMEAPILSFDLVSDGITLLGKAIAFHSVL